MTTGIVLGRTDFGEADRIITVLTPDQGKIRLMAKGVRKIKSKLAGGIELFSISQITYMPGRGELGTLVSSRLERHYGHIVQQIDRTMLAYAILKAFQKLTEDMPEAAYFHMLSACLVGLDDLSLPLIGLKTWLLIHVLELSGHHPSSEFDAAEAPLQADKQYGFDTERMAFVVQPAGRYGGRHLKLLRVIEAADSPLLVKNIQGAETEFAHLSSLLEMVAREQLRLTL